MLFLNQSIVKSIPFSNWIFAPEYAHYNDGIFDSTDLKKEEPLKLSSYKNDDGSYVTQSYKTKFGLDLVSGQYMYSNTWGSNGTTIFSFSDVLGDHRILIGTEMVMDLSNSDYSFQYNYLKPRNDYSIGDGFGEVIEADIQPESTLCNKNLKELNLPKGIRIGSILRDKKVIIPNSQTVFKENDDVVFFAETDCIKKLEKLLSKV